MLQNIDKMITLITISDIMLSLVSLSFLLVLVKGLHSIYIREKTMQMLDRDHKEYLKNAPIEGVDIFRMENKNED